MKLITQIEEDNYIIKLQEEFREQDCPGLSQALDNSCRSFCNQVILECSQLKNITTNGQRILLAYLTRLNSLKIEMVLCYINPDVAQSLKNSGLYNLITIKPTLKEAKLFNRFS